MSKKEYDDDDGRVIAKMDVDGMPWFVRRAYMPRTKSRKEQAQLSRAERAAITRGVLAAALLVFAVFVVAFLLVILFAKYVWFR